MVYKPRSNTMGTFETAVAVYCEAEDEDDAEEEEYYEFEPLPTLLEDEENVSLADILSLRDRCLLEQDIWAVCLECAHSLKSISHSPLFHTLCITPDTLAFNANGNVCFMEQLSDDPEGTFVPPEFDRTGNTFEAHIYSLGSTLTAAIEYIIEPELEPELSQELKVILEQMQLEKPEDRPDIETVIRLGEGNTKGASADICRKLSAIGRRVLSIESVSAFQDGCESPWKGRERQAGVGRELQDYERNPADGSSSTEDLVFDPNLLKNQIANVAEREGKCVQDLVVSVKKNSAVQNSVEERRENENQSLSNDRDTNLQSELDTTSIEPKKMSPVMNLKLAKLSKKKDCPQVESSTPTEQTASSLSDFNKGVISLQDTSSLSPIKQTESGRIAPILNHSNSYQSTLHFLPFKASRTVSVTDLSEILPEAKIVPSLEILTDDSSRSYTKPLLPQEEMYFETNESSAYLPMHSKTSSSPVEVENFTSPVHCVQSPTEPNKNAVSSPDTKPVVGNSKLNHKQTQMKSSPINESWLNNNIYQTEDNHMKKSMLCLNEETQDEWISLKDLLSRCGRPLSVNELWALCHICLYTLQTYIDFPAYLCLDSVYVGCDGELLFLTPKNTGTCDSFYWAPEFQEHGIVTEKVCVYGVAAILWAAAKFNYSPNQKLALPRKLKRLLLEMAKRTPIERPSIAVAQKTFKGDNVVKPEEAADIRHSPSPHESSCFKTGFVPIAGENKLTAIKGPVPCLYSVNSSSNLPDAFLSSATHFRPIILTQNTETAGTKNEYKSSSAKQQVKAIKKEILEKKGLVLVSDIENDVNENVINERQKISQNSTLKQNTSESFPVLLNSAGCTDAEKKSVPTSSSSSSSASVLPGSPIVNNFFLRQDRKTGLITLLPVQVAIPEQLPGLEFSIEPGSSSHQKLSSLLGESKKIERVMMSANPKSNLCEPADGSGDLITPVNHYHALKDNAAAVERSTTSSPISSVTQDIPRILLKGHTAKNEARPVEVVDSFVDSCGDLTMTHPFGSSLSLDQRSSSLQNVICLIKEEFAFDGYLENGVEDLAMGEYILSLKELQFSTFCNAVSEKFCDLYWDERLLETLYKVVNGKHPQTSRVYSKSVLNFDSSASVSRKQRKSQDICEKSPIDLQRNASLNQQLESATGTLYLPGERCTEKGTETSNSANLAEPDKESLPDTEVELPWKDTFDEMDLKNLHPDSHDGNPRNPESPLSGKEEYVSSRACTSGEKDELSLGYTEEIEDTDSVSSERMPENSRSSSPFQTNVRKCNPGWTSVFYGADCFGEEVLNYVKKLGRRNEAPCVDVKMLKSVIEQDLNQELQQQLMIETKNLKKTRTFYQKLLHQDRRNKGSEAKIMLPKLKGQLEEMRSKVEFLELIKKYLEILCMEQWGLDTSLLPTLANSGSGAATLNPSEDNLLLTFQSVKVSGKISQNKTRMLQAGTPLGLMCYLYARYAVLDGYMQQFLYTFRYFCTPKEFLQFLIDTLNSAVSSNQGYLSDCAKVYNRTLDLLQAWVEDCYQVDFVPDSNLLNMLEDFISAKVLPLDNRGEQLLALLHSVPKKKRSHSEPSEDDTKSVHSLCRKISAEETSRKSFHLRMSKGGEAISPVQKEQYSIAAALPRPCYSSLIDELSSSCVRTEENYPLFQSEYNTQQIVHQLTLLQQEMFQGCHPVHFLNSRALGVKDKTLHITKTFGQDTLPLEGSSLFASESSQDQYLLQLLRYGDSVSNWVSAEIVICDTPKAQAGLLCHCVLHTAKLCYELRNFATAMHILCGLENVIVRQLPAWKNLSSKVSEIMEELKAVQVFLKSDNLCLMEGDRFKKLPTIPSAHLLAMHVQQLEIGALTMANGAYKWPKLRNIAKVVSQVHAFQENVYTFVPDLDLQAYLRHRIAQFCQADIPLLAAENNTNFHQIPTEKHSRKIHDTLRRMKATFQ
ncbi:kinase non-catalytic C-lobe domain-containing protein 1-like [Polyodon spathula]|uniref:kinase non-catalytic C-lobe domain-containing protein 1-like n=1 Tax=Polyodon spathula TaxID=7913 RepID=UPI001B7EE915|nr:kinase non-catalytic C-lobe domain-containing protein 1-like [Polyodon spathula]